MVYAFSQEKRRQLMAKNGLQPRTVGQSAQFIATDQVKASELNVKEE